MLPEGRREGAEGGGGGAMTGDGQGGGARASTWGRAYVLANSIPRGGLGLGIVIRDSSDVCCTSRLDHLAGLPPDVLASGAGCPRVRGTEEERVLREGGGDGRKE